MHFSLKPGIYINWLHVLCIWNTNRKFCIMEFPTQDRIFQIDPESTLIGHYHSNNKKSFKLLLIIDNSF